MVSGLLCHWSQQTSEMDPELLHTAVQVVYCKTLKGTVHICRPQIKVRLIDEMCGE